MLVHAALAAFWSSIADRASLVTLDADRLDGENRNGRQRRIACLTADAGGECRT